MNKQQTAKDKILHLLKKKNALTINELMANFSISEVAVRKHLHELNQKGFIKKVSHKQKIGRPYYTYMLTKKGHDTFPNRYDTLPLELLQDLEEMQGLEVVNTLLERMQERERAYFESALHSDDLEKRMREFAEIQNKKGYMLEVKSNNENEFEIINYNCPLASIASNYSQFCVNEDMMLKELFSDGEIEFHSCMTKGDHACRWIVKNTEQQLKEEAN